MAVTEQISTESSDLKTHVDLCQQRYKQLEDRIERNHQELKESFREITESLKQTNKLCVFIVIALGTNYLFYGLHPKSTYMLLHLNSREQNEAWLNIYKEMKLRCKLGLLLGVIGYVLLGNGLCK